MSTRSFPSLTSLVPRFLGKKACLAAVVCLAGCGGNTPETQTVPGNGFAFEAPAGWEIKKNAEAASAASGDVDLIEVRVFPLAKPYDPTASAQVADELDRAVDRLAAKLDGRVDTRETVQVGGRDARAYRVAYDDKVQHLAYVLAGRREYQLLCRRAAESDERACTRLVETFVLR